MDLVLPISNSLSSHEKNLNYKNNLALLLKNEIKISHLLAGVGGMNSSMRSGMLFIAACCILGMSNLTVLSLKGRRVANGSWSLATCLSREI